MGDKVALKDPESHEIMAIRLDRSTAGKGGNGEVEPGGQLWHAWERYRYHASYTFTSCARFSSQI